MSVVRDGVPYEITNEPPLIGARRFAVPIRGDVDDPVWQSAWKSALLSKLGDAGLVVDERTASTMEVRPNAIVFNLRVDQLDSLTGVLDAMEETLELADQRAAAQRELDSRTASAAGEAEAQANQNVQRQLVEWDRAHPRT